MRTAAIAFGCALSACTASADAVRPPANQLFFPTGIAISPSEHELFVTNANSELRYDSGTISVVDLDAVQAVLGPWEANKTVPGADSSNPACAQDPDFSETLVCDEARFIKANAGVRIGNFATDIGVQNFSQGPGDNTLRVVVPTRGDPSISWADFDGTQLSCTSGGGSFQLCDDAHRLTTIRNDPTQLSIPNEPFGVFADGPNGYAVITHMESGAVSLLDSPRGKPALVVDIKENLFNPDLTTDIAAATGVAGRVPGAPGDLVYVSSRTDPRIQTFSVGAIPITPGGAPEAQYLLNNNSFFLDAVGSNDGNVADVRGLLFSQGGNRMYIVDRNPPALVIYDTSLDESGYPRNVAAGASDLCRDASLVTAIDPGDGERAFVTCFDDGQIYVIDPSGQSQLTDIITVGRGPYGITAAHGNNPSAVGRQQLFVTNFLEDTVSVIDLTPNSPYRNRVVLRIGVPKPPNQ